MSKPSIFRKSLNLQKKSKTEILLPFEKFIEIKNRSKDKKKLSLSPGKRNGHNHSPIVKMKLNSIEKTIEELASTKELKAIKSSTKSLIKKKGVICGFAANTTSSLKGSTNNTRVSIVDGIYAENGNHIDFFGLYEGYKGNTCSVFLKKYLHKIFNQTLKEKYNELKSLKLTIEKIEKKFKKQCFDNKGNLIELSGSTVLICVVSGNKIFIANIGDSVAFVSSHNGLRITKINKQHFPMEETEKERILKSGGKIYRSKIETLQLGADCKNEIQIQPGKYKILPGKISISRILGYFGPRLKETGGKTGILISSPEIYSKSISAHDSFLIMLSGYVLETVNEKILIKRIWDLGYLLYSTLGRTQELLSTIMDSILQEYMRDEDIVSEDHIPSFSIIVIFFETFFKCIESSKQSIAPQTSRN